MTYAPMAASLLSLVPLQFGSLFLEEVEQLQNQYRSRRFQHEHQTAGATKTGFFLPKDNLPKWLFTELRQNSILSKFGKSVLNFLSKLKHEMEF